MSMEWTDQWIEEAVGLANFCIRGKQAKGPQAYRFFPQQRRLDVLGGGVSLKTFSN